MRPTSPGDLKADCSGLGYCDGARLGLLVYLKRRAEESGMGAEFAGLDERLKGLLERSDPGPLPKPKPPPGAVVKLGQITAEVARNVIAMITFLGELVMAFVWAVTHPHQVRWRDVLLVVEKAGAEAVPVACLLAG